MVVGAKMGEKSTLMVISRRSGMMGNFRHHLCHIPTLKYISPDYFVSLKTPMEMNLLFESGNFSTTDEV